MTENPSVFQAAYSDFKLIKGRKCAQIILEVPIEAADAALTALGGVPQPHIETWLAIARLDTKAVSDPPKAIAAPPMKPDWPLPTSHRQSFQDGRDHPPKERRSWSALSYAEQAGIRCQEPAFWQFLKEDEQSQENGLHVGSADEAADAVRSLCSVKSRAEIKVGTDAGDYWLALESDYERWLRRPIF